MLVQRVFISYRRRDTAREAHLLKTYLESLLRDVAVFIDTDDIPPATAWPDRLERELARSMAVIALIGPDWRPTVGDDPLLSEDDWVRRELEIALEHKPDAVLPVVVENAKHHLADLPPSLAHLAAQQVLRLSAEGWMEELGHIVSWLAGKLGAEAQPLGEAWPKPDEMKRVFPALAQHDIERLLESGGATGWISRPTVVKGDTTIESRELYKVFEFTNFKRAFNFMQAVAVKAEQFNHHPDWRNTWNRVAVSLRTWDAGHVITNIDFQMAAYLNQAAARCAAMDAPSWPVADPLGGD